VGIVVFLTGLMLAIIGSTSDLILMFLMTSAQAFVIGLILSGSTVFLVGRLME